MVDNHRISHTYSLGPGTRICRVCRVKVDWIYGAYSCSKFPDFFVHSKCATNFEVWDGQELEGLPEEEEDEPMFKMIGDGVINHVKHPSHNLRLDDGVVRDEGIRCRLCDHCVYSDKCYSCIECDFILHETCAYLPQRKRLSFSRFPFSLKKEYEAGYFMCNACETRSTGYNYSAGYNYTDLRCAAVDWSCDHECHPHTLFLTNLDNDPCGACSSYRYVLRCIECKFNLCYKCATYPRKIKHRCDDHPLVLSFGEKEEQHGRTYWCTVCESRIDLQKWFYECEECGIVCHIHCVFGDFANYNPGRYTTKDVVTEAVVHNNGVTRPRCSVCGSRCLAPFIYSRKADNYCCSWACYSFGDRGENNFRKGLVQKAVLHFLYPD